ncbi:FAD:protein FMN transferase [Streptococcus chenjunshii]|uniref:FAD:protein FMN transferase n=1 Tax=Streptococcus chenjunshii TaxID=2173853 RepID=A0A372KP62_9STRE|nr:FAD:protein FMN transferase [Streptococcus chenjunshii]AXQ78657.1 FAD:protein FMN transferase [Streptococcus chenjunshii]RFU51879.1 FAD:protein FMN transferase [Streptococcus chenjunshii]RFU54071.1 FAD:protein FMN transferase [Streptococcus chenjunshii]
MQVSHSLKMMGTQIDIQIDSPKAQEQLLEVCRLLEVYNQRFSANDDHSELMMVNRNAGIQAVEVNPELFELIVLGKKHSLASPSNLNIALGPLVRLWHIGFEDARLPSEEEIRSCLPLTNPENIVTDAKKQTVFLTKKGMKIDLGALAKGYIADKVMAGLIKDGISAALINLGGNVLVHGRNKKRDDESWYIGIQNPKQPRGSNLGIVKIRDKSVVTSGIYERHLQIGQTDYHHIFDRQTGFPIETEMASLTIIAERSVDCEIWTTRLFGLPLIDVLQTINKETSIEGIIITKDNRIALSDGLKENFQLLYN